ncbi:MAG: outer membrane lipoprotein carrier protein LolA [Saprospiraceae bacterium]
MRTITRIVLFIIVFVSLASVVLAQAGNAKADLQALRTKYEAGGSLQADVALEIQFPESPAEVQTGTITQSGERFRVEFDQQIVISDGETVWMYLPDNKEVQVYDADDSDTNGGFMSPQDLLTIYDSDGYEYDIVGEVQENGTTLRQIEFKPTDRESEMSKIRLTYDPVKNEIRRVRVFNKDGSRFALLLTSVKTGQEVADATFTFQAKDYPGVMVEDMRL